MGNLIIPIPRLQFERFHRTVRNGLICKYLENTKKFNLHISLIHVVDTLNHTKHYTTKFKPIDIFYSEDLSLFKK